MTETLDIAQLKTLLDSDVLGDDERLILKNVINRIVRLMPKMVDKMEEIFNE